MDHQRQNRKSWAKNDLVELANYFHVGPLAILRKLLDNGLTTKSFYIEKHQAWNKPTFGRAKRYNAFACPCGSTLGLPANYKRPPADERSFYCIKALTINENFVPWE